MPMKADGGAKQNTSHEQGMQVSMATGRAATTTMHRHTDKVSGDTYQPHYLPRPPKREGREGKTATQSTIRSMKELHNLTASMLHLTLGENPICQIGTHDPRSPLTSIGAILT